MFQNASLKANGDIRTCRFVKIDSSDDNLILEADANEAIIGISPDHAQDAPISGASANAAAQGDAIAINPIGSVCLLEAGSGGWTAGDELKSDADGKGVTRASTGTTVQNVGAIAFADAAAGDLSPVLVFRSSIRPALV